MPPAEKDAPSTEPSPGGKARSPLEIAGLAGAAAIFITFVVFLSRMLSTDLVDASANDPTSFGDLDLPLDGAVVKITGTSAGWRPLRESDRTDKRNKIIPEVTVTASPAAGETGYLKIQFLDPEGKVSGDVKTLRIDGELSEAVYGTQGIADETSFISYKFGAGGGSWAIELLEGAEYGSEEWTRLAYFKVPNTLEADPGTPAE